MEKLKTKGQGVKDKFIINNTSPWTTGKYMWISGMFRLTISHDFIFICCISNHQPSVTSSLQFHGYLNQYTTWWSLSADNIINHKAFIPADQLLTIAFSLPWTSGRSFLHPQPELLHWLSPDGLATDPAA